VNLLNLAGFALLVVSVVLMLGLSFLRRKAPPSFREIPAYTNLKQAIGRVVEDGSRLHLSLGRGALTTPQSASALAGLTLLRRLADLTSASDNPPVATSGDAALSVLSQDTLQSAAHAAGQSSYDPTNARLTGLTPFSYAAGALPVIRDENVTTNILMGNFGMEAGLLMDASEHENAFTLAASDNPSAQAIMYASGGDPLIGEELFAAGAYVEAGPMHVASLTVQDILRWLVVLAILAGAALKLIGLL
jgi:hypothetical protein